MNEREDQNLGQRLEALGRSVPASDRFTRTVMERLPREPAGGARNPHTMRWVMRGTIGLAACALVGAFAWTLLLSEPQQAYGIADLRQRIAGVQSLYMAGHQADGSPMELYVDRPDRSYAVQHAVRTVMTAEQRMVVDDGAKTAVVGPSSRTDARFLVEMAIQYLATNQLLGPAPDRLRKVRTERVGDVPADVYETVLAQGPVGVRTEVYLNPRTGLPVKSVLYAGTGSDGKEEPMMTFDRIEANGPAPAGAFDFKAPAGYAVRQEKQVNARPDIAVSDGKATVRFGLRYGFEVAGGRAVLVCWALYDQDHPAEDLKLPDKAWKFSVAGVKSNYAERTLRTNASEDGYHWRWSLLVPTDQSVPVSENLPTMRVQGKNAVHTNTVPVVRLDRGDLASMVAEAQRETLPAGGRTMTLEKIEAMIDGKTP